MNPSCPNCGSQMVRRIARQGRNSGNAFWGCPKYPRCKGVKGISSVKTPNVRKTSSRSSVSSKPTKKRVTTLLQDELLPDEPTKRVDERFKSLIENRVGQWKEQLMDLSRRNNLLFFRETKTQHLDLSKANQGELVKLLAGESVSVDKLFTFPGETSTVAEEAKRRLKSVFAKATENYEERSLDTLSVGVGECSWDFEGTKATGAATGTPESKVPRAPILLVSAEVKRGQKKGDFNLSIDPNEAEINPVLQYVLKKDHGIELVLPEENENQTDLSIDQKISLLTPLIEEAPKGSVKFGAQLSNFSYAKLAMVQDLDEGIDAMTTHQLILAIADNQNALSEIRGNMVDPQIDAPNRIPPEDEYLILDADSSQNMVINAILKGQSFAFDGPPGTGKSQTIANAIAALIADKKKVLFVAEKRAAIEAVMKRLETVGLTELVMDYHGTNKKKKDIIENLKIAYSTIHAGIPRQTGGIASEFKKERDTLVEQSNQLHMKRDPWGLSIYELLCIRGKYEKGSETQFRFPSVTQFSFRPENVDHIESLIKRMWNLGGFVDSPGAKRWRAAAINAEGQAEQLIDVLSDASGWKIANIEDSLHALANSMGTTILKLDGLRNLVKAASEAKPIQLSWGNEILNSDLGKLAEQLKPAQNPLTRILAAMFKNEYRSGVKEFRRLTAKKAKGSTALQTVVKAKEVSNIWKLLRQDFKFPDVSQNTNVELADTACKSLTELMLNLDAFSELRFALSNDLEITKQMVGELLSDRHIASSVWQSNTIERELSTIGVERLILESRVGNVELNSIIQRLWYSWSQSLIERLGSSSLGLNEHSSAAFQKTADSFKELDRKHIDGTPGRIREIWASNAIETGINYPKEQGALLNALNRKRKLPPITQLFKQSKHVVSALKPCWVMSPLSVSMLRPPCEWFDVVIFDEASQILPADAITAIKAAKQVVVAGDDRQLPPTSFFASGDPKEEEISEETEFTDDIQVGNYESILSLMKSIVTKPRQLQWHYRSRDERLIAFSNNRIYKSLITFPNSNQIGTLNFANAGSGPDAISRGATNKAEVRKVVDLVIEHAQNRPNESLGVIALGSPHANAIEAALNSERELNDVLDEFMELHQDERFFIKNLERVQGDERDAIILTAGYGRNEKNEMRYNFGPINGKHGERRLNVATTRAKQRMTLVTTFTELELEKSQCSTGGMSFLRDYVAYVRSGGENFGDTDAIRPEVNAFERSIQVRLEREGLILEPQYGVGKYLIDFAVRNPKDPSVFALAVECDGASYHSQPTARERDRLRQELLESRGWKFHRIWSTDWFRDPDLEVGKCLEALAKAIGDN
jgi:very-short-patch-repair endonuclease